jgi:two-component system sensor histidine kinase CreC
VAKPTTSINAFIQQARPRVIEAGVLSLAAAVVLSLFFSFWLTRPIKRLIGYAEGIRENRRTPFPELGTSEIAELGDALRRMQETLEGKQYVEEYVQNLTHEIKSPLSAIRGAAELLEEEMPPEARARFLANIRNESARIAKIIDTMLELAALENRRLLPEMERVGLHSLLQTVLESKQPLLSLKRLQVAVYQPDALAFTGNAFLLHQALSNLLQNAIEFSLEGGRLTFSAEAMDGNLVLIVEDEGPGIPDYAVGRIFDKFYSLQRPDTGKKSTGLGLNLVREVASLHHGTIELANRLPKGVRAVLILPLTPPVG